MNFLVQRATCYLFFLVYFGEILGQKIYQQGHCNICITMIRLHGQVLVDLYVEVFVQVPHALNY
ncbi:hypothetical protein KC19_7G021800 [Ceratodon purpureus]|uniref:Secreted protein n=1 Tax=Ceratodon purpureus TaxID=3225 RepID=A0A8T0H1Y8_CERPU|nr:hypothetical protein KC19_7G021800 [Ceratodon purpureus]